jgi:hypothetical protein
MTDLEEVVAHLGAALMQTSPSDDQIIIEHVREAHRFAQSALRNGAPKLCASGARPTRASGALPTTPLRMCARRGNRWDTRQSLSAQ